jgi:hypothetical protein
MAHLELRHRLATPDDLAALTAPMATLAGGPPYRACGYQPGERLTDGRGGAPVPMLRMSKAL